MGRLDPFVPATSALVVPHPFFFPPCFEVEPSLYRHSSIGSLRFQYLLFPQLSPPSSVRWTSLTVSFHPNCVLYIRSRPRFVNPSCFLPLERSPTRSVRIRPKRSPASPHTVFNESRKLVFFARPTVLQRNALRFLRILPRILVRLSLVSNCSVFSEKARSLIVQGIFILCE